MQASLLKERRESSGIHRSNKRELTVLCWVLFYSSLYRLGRVEEGQ